MSRFKKPPSPAMVIALVALFVSMGGVSYGLATGSVNSREIKNNTVRSKDIRNNQVRGRDIRNRTIRFRDVECPPEQRRYTTACFSESFRGPATFDQASNSCAQDGRRLPTASELLAFRNENGITLANQEMSSNVEHSGATFRYITVSDNGTLNRIPVNQTRQFRCVVAMRD